MRPCAALGSMDVLREPGEAAPDVLLIGAGPMAVTCAQAAQRLADQGIGVTVLDPRWLKPLDQALVGAAREHRLVVVVEDNGRSGGFGDAVCRLLRDHGVDTPAKTFGLPQEFLAHGDPRRDAGRGWASPRSTWPGRSPRRWPRALPTWCVTRRHDRADRRRHRLRPGRPVHGRGADQAGRGPAAAGARPGRGAGPAAHPVRAGPVRRRPRPQVDQVDRRVPAQGARASGRGVPRRRAPGRRRHPGRPAGQLRRGGVRDRRDARPPPRHPRRGPAGQLRGDRLRQLVLRAPGHRPARPSPWTPSRSR